MAKKYFYARSKRRSAICSLKLFRGKTESTVNGKKISKYFPLKTQLTTINLPFGLTEIKILQIFHIGFYLGTIVA